MVTWNSLRFLMDRSLLFPSVMLFLFGHLILVNNWITYLIPELFQATAHPHWFAKLATTPNGKIILIYFSSFFLSLSIIFTNLFSGVILKKYPSKQPFVDTAGYFFSTNKDAESLIKNELNSVEKLSQTTKSDIKSMYRQLLSQNEDELAKQKQREKIMHYLYELKNRGNYTPWLTASLFALSVLINVYLSFSVFAQVCVATFRILNS